MGALSFLGLGKEEPRHSMKPAGFCITSAANLPNADGWWPKNPLPDPWVKARAAAIAEPAVQ